MSLLEETWESTSYLKTKEKIKHLSYLFIQTKSLDSQIVDEGKFIIRDLFQEKVKKKEHNGYITTSHSF